MYITEKIYHSCDHCPDCGLSNEFSLVQTQKFVQHNVQILLYSNWLKKQGRKPEKFIGILKGLTNELKKIGALEQDDDLLLINDVDKLFDLYYLYLSHKPYTAKGRNDTKMFYQREYIKFVDAIYNIVSQL